MFNMNEMLSKLKEMQEEMEFEIRYFIDIRQVKSRISVRSEVLTQIWNMFETHHILAPYSSYEVFLKESKSLGGPVESGNA